MDNMNSNFDRLTNKWQSLGKLGKEAEQYVISDPSVALFKLRLYAEKMTDEILRFEGIDPRMMDNQVDKLSKLEEKQLLPAEILIMFHNIRKAGNRAAHAGEGTSGEASILLSQASHLSSWFIDRYVANNHTFDKFRREAEQYVNSDPSVTLFKLRVFAEKMIDEILDFEEIIVLETDHQIDKLSRLEEEQRLPANILRIFHNIRRAGNRAAHAGEGTTEEAKILLIHASHLSSWFTEHYMENDGYKERKPLDNTQQYTSVGKNKFSNLFVRIRPLPVFILSVSFIAYRAGIGIAFCIAIFFILYMLSRGRLHKSGYRTTGWTTLSLFCAFFISVLLIHFINEGSENIEVELYPSDYATLYINDEPQPINTTDTTDFHGIHDGSKVHAEWSFPWGEMKSDTDQVEDRSAFVKLLDKPQSISLEPEAEPQLKKQLTNFFNAFAKRCIQSTRADDPKLAPFVSGKINDTCADASDNDHEKLVETGIAFNLSGPNSYELTFGLNAYFKYEVNGRTEAYYGVFYLVYDKTKKRWFIDSEPISSDPEYFKDNPEVVITKF